MKQLLKDKLQGIRILIIQTVMTLINLALIIIKQAVILLMFAVVSAIPTLIKRGIDSSKLLEMFTRSAGRNIIRGYRNSDRKEDIEKKTLEKDSSYIWTE